jgi:BirA family biotin operon repressor/biotin-[acetyl-CoA-carboxylase] ligase
MKIGRKIHLVESCSSTNDLANQKALQGEEEGTVIIAEKQTEGRGTKGRKWFSISKKGLYLSIILRPRRKDLSLLPLAFGLAVKDALFEAESLDVRLKWPNDLVHSGKKLGGILCEASFIGNEMSHVILGIGINLNHDQSDFPEEISSQATSLKLLLKKNIDRDIFLSGLWEILDDWYHFFLRGKDIQIIKGFEDCSTFSIGEELSVETENERFRGEYRGLDLKGRLLLVDKGRERSLLAAEIIEITKEPKED